MSNSAVQDGTSKSQEAGISLVESIIVVLVLASVLAFTLPATGTMIRAYQVRSAATHMAERLTAVRTLAMTKNKNVTFSFNMANGHFGFDFTTPVADTLPDYPGGPDLTTPLPDGDPDTVDPDDRTTGYYRETLPSGMTATFPGDVDIKVTFNSRGELPIGDTEQTIAIQSSGKSANVRVNLRGRIWIE